MWTASGCGWEATRSVQRTSRPTSLHLPTRWKRAYPPEAARSLLSAGASPLEIPEPDCSAGCSASTTNATLPRSLRRSDSGGGQKTLARFAAGACRSCMSHWDKRLAYKGPAAFCKAHGTTPLRISIFSGASKGSVLAGLCGPAHIVMKRSTASWAPFLS